MRNWTVQDEINFCKWFEDKGFVLAYMPEIEQWGYYHIDSPKAVMGGFTKLIELKQHLVNIKGENKDVRVISDGARNKAMEESSKLLKLH